MGLSDLGLNVGARASLVVLDAGDPVEALRLRPARLAVISRGKIISRSPRGQARLSLSGRPELLSRRHSVQ
jgi:cytosine/creatinine deaminase